MTIDAAIPLATFTIAGTGPYPFTWPYAAGTIAVAVLTDEGWTDLSALQATISPEASAAGGAVTLQPAVVTQYAGRPMHIRRSTPREQGWAGLVGSREKGLEAALDQLALQMQEIGAASDRSLRVLGTEVPPADLEAGRAVVWDGTRFVGGPNADDLAHAEEYAERAEAAAAGISSAVYGVKHFATTDFALANGRGPYALDFDPLAGEYLDVELDGQSVYADQHWRVVPMASPTGWGIELLDDTPTGHQLAYSFRGIRNTTLGLPDLITNNPGDVYTRDTPLTIESGTRIPHKLKLNWTGPAHTVPLILGEGVYLDQFELLTSAPGVNFYSPKGFQGRTFKWTSTIESATSVFTAHPEDLCFEQMEFDNVGRGLVLSGEPVGNPAWVPYVTISGVRYKNPDFDPDAWTRPGGGWIGRMHLRGYFRSLWFKYMEEFRFGEIDFGRKMTGALGDPGNNGILTTGAKDISIIKAIIANAPEHAVRGAGEWAQKKSEILRFGSLTVIEPGESGIKINGNKDILFGEEKQKTSYTGIHIDDYELVGNFVSGGQNSDALRATGADGAFIGKMKVSKAAGAERACQDVVSLDFTTGLTIGHLQSEDHSGVVIACRGDMDGEAPGDVTDCTFGRVVAKGGNHLLLADMKGSGAYATTWGSVGGIRILDGIFAHGGDLARFVTGTGVTAPCEIAGTCVTSALSDTWATGDLRLALRRDDRPIAALAVDTTEGLAATSDGDLFAVATAGQTDLYVNADGLAVLQGADVETLAPVIPEAAPTAAAIIASAQSLKANGVPLKKVMGRSYSSGNDGAATLNAVTAELAAAGLTITDPDGMVIRLNSTLFLRDDMKMDLGLHTTFLRGFETAFATLAAEGATSAANRRNRVKWRGGTFRPLSESVGGGHQLTLAINDSEFRDVNVLDFRRIAVGNGGHGMRMHGSRNRIINPTVSSATMETGTAGIRIVCGDDNMVLGGYVQSGDDALQFRAAVDATDHPLFNESCTNSYYIGVNVRSASKAMIAAMVSSTGSVTGSTGLFRNLGFMGITGYYGTQAVLIGNDSGLNTIDGQLDGIVVQNCGLEKRDGSSIGVSTNMIHITGAWTGAVRNVILDGLTIDGSLFEGTDIALTLSAPGAIIKGGRNVFRSRIRGMRVSQTADVNITADFIVASEGLEADPATRHIINVETPAAGSKIRLGPGSRLIGVSSPTIASVVTPMSGIYVAAGSFVDAGDATILKRPGSSGTTAMTVVGGSSIQFGDVTTDCDNFFGGAGDPHRKLDSLGAAKSVTIAGGVIAMPTASEIILDTEGGAATDDLDTITPFPGIMPGTVVVLRTTNNGRDVVVKHGTGNIEATSGTDFTLTLTTSRATLIWNGVKFVRLG